jgi:antitoxin MazE
VIGNDAAVKGPDEMQTRPGETDRGSAWGCASSGGDYHVITLDLAAPMRTRLVRIGNSRGVRIPKLLLEQAGLEDEVELRVVEHGIVIESVRAPRAGWEEAARLVRERGEDGLLDEPTPTRFDETEWEWR